MTKSINFSDMNNTLDQLNFGFLSKVRSGLRDKIDNSADSSGGISRNIKRSISNKLDDKEVSVTEKKIAKVFNIKDDENLEEKTVALEKASKKLASELRRLLSVKSVTNEEGNNSKVISRRTLLSTLGDFLATVNPEYTGASGSYDRRKENSKKDDQYSKEKTIERKIEKYKDALAAQLAKKARGNMGQATQQRIIETKIRPAIEKYRKQLMRDVNAEPKSVDFSFVDDLLLFKDYN